MFVRENTGQIALIRNVCQCMDSTENYKPIQADLRLSVQTSLPILLYQQNWLFYQKSLDLAGEEQFKRELLSHRDQTCQAHLIRQYYLLIEHDVEEQLSQLRDPFLEEGDEE